jgi:hypothetical protein
MGKCNCCCEHRWYGKSIWLKTNGVEILLNPFMEATLAVNLHVDQTDTQTILATDAKGNPVTPVTWDAPPVWTNSNTAAATNVVSPDGTSNVLTPVSSGVGQTTTVTVTALFGGAKFTASTDYLIVSGAIAQIAIVDTIA